MCSTKPPDGTLGLQKRYLTLFKELRRTELKEEYSMYSSTTILCISTAATLTPVFVDAVHVRACRLRKGRGRRTCSRSFLSARTLILGPIGGRRVTRGWWLLRVVTLHLVDSPLGRTTAKASVFHFCLSFGGPLPRRGERGPVPAPSTDKVRQYPV